MAMTWTSAGIWICVWIHLATTSSAKVGTSTPEASLASTKGDEGSIAGLLAGYIAAGIGITSHDTVSTLPTGLLSTGQDSLNSSGSTGGTVSTTHGQVAAGVSANSSNDACWNSWVDYWSSSVPYSIPATTSWVTVTDYRAYEPYLTTTISISENSWTLTSLSTEYSDDYPISVHTSLTTSSAGGTLATVTSYSTITTTSLRSYPATSYRTTTRSVITTPQCHLPPLVPHCESQWSSYMAEQDTITNELTPKPPCTQASVDSSGCETLVSQYLFQWTWNGETEGAGYQTRSNSTYWPTSKSFAPGCSLGCRACSITGQSVQLYWWPPATMGLIESGTQKATLEAATTSSDGPVSVLVAGTYLTSPTIYISYNTLYVSDSCSGIGATYTDTIIPLAQSSHLFSMETRWDPSISVHGFKTVPFDYSDLIEPIPDSIYNKQLRCQTSYTDFIKAGELMRNATFSCARTAPYAPILAVPGEVRGLDAAWEGCEAWYGGLYDPPLALQPASVEVTPTLSVLPSPTQASPNQSADPGSPQQTALPLTQPQEPSSPTASQNSAEIVAGIFMASSVTASATQSSVTPDPTSGGSKAMTSISDDFHAAVTLDGQTFSIDGTYGTVFVNGMQAKVDHIVTVSGHTFSVGSSAMAIDDTTVIYATAGQLFSTVLLPASTTGNAGHQKTLTLGDQAYTVEKKSGYLFINGMQAELDHPVTVSGHVFIAESSMLEVDSTNVLTYASSTQAHGVSTGPTTTEDDTGQEMSSTYSAFESTRLSTISASTIVVGEGNPRSSSTVASSAGRVLGTDLSVSSILCFAMMMGLAMYI